MKSANNGRNKLNQFITRMVENAETEGLLYPAVYYFYLDVLRGGIGPSTQDFSVGPASKPK